MMRTEVIRTIQRRRSGQTALVAEPTTQLRRRRAPRTKEATWPNPREVEDEFRDAQRRHRCR